MKRLFPAWMTLSVGFCLSGLCSSSGFHATAVGVEPSALHPALRFYAPFDQSLDAAYARGDRRLYTADTLQRTTVEPGLKSDGVLWNQDEGVRGGSLQFQRKTEKVLFYQGGENVPFSATEFEGTVSLWMKLAPNEDLPDGYVDPLQITDQEWNNRAMFLDFTDTEPRDFRLGVFSDYKFWNPRDIPWEKIAVKDRPMVVASKPPFAQDRWTHVVMTWERFNREQVSGEATLYLNAQRMGTLEGPQQFSWDPQRVVILLGIYYVGGMDELAIFDRPLTPEEVEQLYANKLWPESSRVTPKTP